MVKVLDFGIARFAAGNEPDETPQLTKTGTLIGTPLYMSPEQALGKPVDHRSDLYALGVLLYQMATGVPPFTDPQPVRVLFMHAQQTPIPANEVAGGRLPARLDALITAMLAKDPDLRPQTATEVQRALQACGESDTLIDGDTLPAPRSRLAQDPAAMDRARAGHADPQSRIATRLDPVTIDDDADFMSETVFGGRPDDLGDVGLESAPTMAASAAELLVAGDAGIETAEPMMAPASTLTSGPSTEALQAAQHAPPPRPVAAEAVAESPPAAIGPQTEQVELPGPKTVSSEAAQRAQGRSWLMPAVVGGVLLAAAGYWLATKDGAQGANAPIQEAASQAPAAVAAAPVEAASMAARRTELSSLQAAAGDPAPPASCRLRDPAALPTLLDVTRLLAGGRPRTMRPDDLKAVTLLAQVTATHAEQPEVAATLAKALLFSGRASDPVVVDHAEQASRACPDWALPHEIIGRVHLLGGRSAAAMRHFERALARAPEFLRAHYNLGLAALAAKEPVAAAGHFGAVLARDAEHRHARLARGQAHLIAGEHGKAIADLERLTKAHDEDKLGWFLLGGAYTGAKRPADAKRAWCRAGELGHKQAKALCAAP